MIVPHPNNQYECKQGGLGLVEVVDNQVLCGFLLGLRRCKFNDKFCSVYIAYEQSQPKCTEPQVLDFQIGKEALDSRKRAEAYERIVHLSDHLFPKS